MPKWNAEWHVSKLSSLVGTYKRLVENNASNVELEKIAKRVHYQSKVIEKRSSAAQANVERANLMREFNILARSARYRQ